MLVTIFTLHLLRSLYNATKYYQSALNPLPRAPYNVWTIFILVLDMCLVEWKTRTSNVKDVLSMTSPRHWLQFKHPTAWLPACLELILDLVINRFSTGINYRLQWIQRVSWSRLCRRWWYHRMLWHNTVPQGTTKLSPVDRLYRVIYIKFMYICNLMHIHVLEWIHTRALCSTNTACNVKRSCSCKD